MVELSTAGLPASAQSPGFLGSVGAGHWAARGGCRAFPCPALGLGGSQGLFPGPASSYTPASSGGCGGVSGLKELCYLLRQQIGEDKQCCFLSGSPIERWGIHVCLTLAFQAPRSRLPRVNEPCPPRGPPVMARPGVSPQLLSHQQWHPQLFFLPVRPFRTHFRCHLLGTPTKALLPVLGSKEAPPATCSSTVMRVGRICCCLSGLSRIQKEQVQGASSTLLELLPCGAPAWGHRQKP